jgi:hypothetical protein
MATTASPTSIASHTGASPLEDAGLWHRLRLRSCWLAFGSFVLGLFAYGFPYYRLDLAQRAASAYHAQLRPSGTIGLRLGMLGVALFIGLFLYPIRKRWPWLSRIGKTRNWLDFHVLLGVMAPLVVTLHASFKFGGLAGVAYWIMIAVALSGFVGRYLYAQIPRSLNTAELSRKEMEGLANKLAAQLREQAVLMPEEIAPILELPSPRQVDEMPLLVAVWTIFRLDLARPFLVSRVRRKFLSPLGKTATLGGLLPSRHRELEGVISACSSQAWMSAKMLFLNRVHDLFHLWHIIHRPFSYSFAVLVVVHIGVVVLLGYF